MLYGKWVSIGIIANAVSKLIEFQRWHDDKVYLKNDHASMLTIHVLHCGSRASAISLFLSPKNTCMCAHQRSFSEVALSLNCKLFEKQIERSGRASDTSSFEYNSAQEIETEALA